ncbi:MAG: hypothetical protein M3380_06150, partial [Chloroflexota bacterium]|nr:hypothetical protein [Chloroflexota bacterium]
MGVRILWWLFEVWCTHDITPALHERSELEVCKVGETPGNWPPRHCQIAHAVPPVSLGMFGQLATV